MTINDHENTINIIITNTIIIRSRSHLKKYFSITKIIIKLQFNSNNVLFYKLDYLTQ